MRFGDVGGLVVPDVVRTFVRPIGFDAGPIKSPNRVLVFFKACLSWSSSSLSNRGLEQAVLVLCARVLMPLNLAASLWWLFNCRYKLCMFGLSLHSSDEGVVRLWHHQVSKKEMDSSSLVASDVNWIWGSKLLRCFSNFSLCDVFVTTKVSSTYLFKILGGCSAVLVALVLNCSLYSLATMELMGDPMTAPCSCSKNLLESGSMWSSGRTPVSCWYALLSWILPIGAGCHVFDQQIPWSF